MKQFLSVISFSLITIALFSWYSSFGIPKIEPAAPPVQEELDLGAMTMDQFIALGEKLIPGKGACTLCHNEMGRAPMLNEIVANTEIRLADPNYEGEAKDLAAYIYESMVKPSAYVVPGYGKAGAKSPMPDVSGGSIGFSEAETLAVIAYLQDSSGVEVTVEIPTDAADMAEEEDGEDGAEAREPYESAEDIIDEFGCGNCHIFADNEGELGPDLSTFGASYDKDYIRRALLDPNADIAEGYDEDTMPDDLGTQLYATELELLVDYLADLK